MRVGKFAEGLEDGIEEMGAVVRSCIDDLDKLLENGETGAMVGGVLLTALVFEMLNSKSGDIKAWVKTKLNDTTFINKVNTVVENSITKVFSKADQYALLSGKIEKVLESLKTSLSEEAFEYLKNNLQKEQISDLMEAVRKLEKELGTTEIKLSKAQVKKLLESLKDGKGVDSVVAELKTWCEKIERGVKPSKPYDSNAKPGGKPTKITDKMDDTTKRSLKRENESAETIAKSGYEIEQNPVVEGTTRKPDYRIEGEIFDCYSPEAKTSTRSIQSSIKKKVVQDKQTNRIVLNLDDWEGSIDVLIQELIDYPVEGLEEVLVVKDNTVFSIYP